jgi:septal ring factor EnvC (AmiA/AmiB activator)
MNVKHFFILLCCFFISFDSYASNEKQQQDLVKIKQELAKQKKEKEKLEKQDKAIKEIVSENEKRLISIASNIKESEKKISGLDNQLNFLNKQQGAYESEMLEMQKEMSETVAVLQMFALTPQPVLFETSKDVSAQLNSAISLENSLLMSEEKFNQYMALMEKIESNRKEISKTKVSLDKNKSELTKKQSNMKSVIDEQSKKLQSIQKEKKAVDSKISKLAKESKNLEDFLKRALSKPTASGKYEKYTGSAPLLAKAPMPVNGTIIQGFGEQNENKIKSEGWRIRTIANATVTSPHDGVVIFADYFKGYNKMVIIEHNKNFHTILANMDQIYIAEGQSVKKGVPVGQVGVSKVLYLEVRYKNKPLNPKFYFR